MAQTMESLMAVKERSEGIIGKFFYYSTAMRHIGDGTNTSDIS